MRMYFKGHKGTIKPLDGTAAKYLIWGDWLDVQDHPTKPDHYVVNWNQWDPVLRRYGIKPHEIRRDQCQSDALLEMMFLDVGQGDGCIVNVPDGNIQHTLIIDAGLGGNMHGFLNWRFRNQDAAGAFHTAVITHPDSDHYGGFQRLFDDPRITFGQVFHNGLVERVAARDSDRIGPRKDGFCTELFPEPAGLLTFLTPPTTRGAMLYPKLLWTALGRYGDVRMASTLHGEVADGKTWLPGFAPGATQATTIQILGPVPGTLDGAAALKTFGDAPNDGGFDVGKTKNGHSIILKLTLGAFRVIFGGDLNRPSEDHLLRHYGEIGLAAPLADAVTKARVHFAADILKCCHHGSADVTDEFLDAVTPFGFVVSSGDEEGHVHPRPEVLGLLGKKGRGDRPLVLCTEILRSTPPRLTLSTDEKKRHETLLDAVVAADTPAAEKTARKAISAFWDGKIDRLVSVYGAINIRTDGQTLIVAFRKEKKGRSPWQLFTFKHDGDWKPVPDDEH